MSVQYSVRNTILYTVLLFKHFKRLVVGAGAGGCSVANKFASHLGADKVGIIEPKDVCIILFSEL
jgi:adenine/guanine phosphoribosyltransferase-like PRPP-binding protein